MDEKQTIAALAALAQPTPLQTFRILAAHEPEGVAAGELARLVGVPQNTMSAHLSTLAQAGLVTAEQEGRYVRYRAEMPGINALLAFLTEDCCSGHPERCTPKGKSND